MITAATGNGSFNARNADQTPALLLQQLDFSGFLEYPLQCTMREMVNACGAIPAFHGQVENRTAPLDAEIQQSARFSSSTPWQKPSH